MTPKNYSYKNGKDENYDIFICHASEDKDEFVRPLAEGLRAKGLKVWYDEFSLKIGDSLRESIDSGLANSSSGVVVISHNFFKKRWPQKELNGLFSKIQSDRKIILPIWHNISAEEISAYSPLLADIISARSSDGLDEVISSIIAALK